MPLRPIKADMFAKKMQKSKFSKYSRILYQWKENFMPMKNYYGSYYPKTGQKKLQ